MGRTLRAHIPDEPETLDDLVEVEASPPAETAPAVPTLIEDRGWAGDAIVLVRLIGDTAFTRVWAREPKRRQIALDGRPCEHIATAPDGTWMYEQRTS